MLGILEYTLAFFAANYLPFIMVYIIGGIIYSVLKWTFKIVKLRRLVVGLEDKQNKYDVKRIDTIEDQRNLITRKEFGDYQTYPPLAKNNKSWLFFWALFWPINLVWTLIADVATETWAWIYGKFGSLLDKIAKSILPE